MSTSAITFVCYARQSAIGHSDALPAAHPQAKALAAWLGDVRQEPYVQTVFKLYETDNRRIFEVPYIDAATGVQVYPVLVTTGA